MALTNVDGEFRFGVRSVSDLPKIEDGVLYMGGNFNGNRQLLPGPTYIYTFHALFKSRVVSKR